MIKHLAVISLGVVSALISGCQTMDGRSPYQYRFDDPADKSICLFVRDDKLESLGLEVRRALEDKGFRVRDVGVRQLSDCTQCVRFSAKMGGWAGAQLERAHMEYTRRSEGIRHKVSATETCRHVKSLGVPVEDHLPMIRSLVDRLFPDPVPWDAAN